MSTTVKRPARRPVTAATRQQVGIKQAGHHNVRVRVAAIEQDEKRRKAWRDPRNWQNF